MISKIELVRNIIVALLALLLSGATQAAGGPRMTAEQAYDTLRQTGELRGVTITTPFDFDRLEDHAPGQPSPDAYLIRDVEFEQPVSVGPKLHADVRIESSYFKQRVSMRHCELQRFTASQSRWEGDFVVEECRFNGLNRFERNDFQADVRFHLVRFQQRPGFKGTVFHGRAEFLECQFAIDSKANRATSFSDVVFEGPAIFNNSIFHTRVKFLSTLFQQDASFLNVRMDGGASFRNVHFRGDAEFRLCRISLADFGDWENLTLFSKRADFRGCTIEKAVFDYTEFRGETNFVNVAFGDGGATFRNAYLGNKIADFNGVSFKKKAPLVLTGAPLTNLRFHWREIGEAVLAAKPDSKVLAALQARFESLGQREDALDVSYHLSRSKFTGKIARGLPSPMESFSGFIDAVGLRLAAYGEWLLWGWPSGYGTKLGRVLLLTLACWLIAAFPVALTPGVVARVCYDPQEKREGKTEKNRRLYDPLTPEDLELEPWFPKTFPGRFFLALKFIFRLMFKVGPDDARYVVTRFLSARRSLWKIYFAFLWSLGSGLLVLLMLTLANTSPMINKLIGELLT